MGKYTQYYRASQEGMGIANLAQALPSQASVFSPLNEKPVLLTRRHKKPCNNCVG